MSATYDDDDVPERAEVLRSRFFEEPDEFALAGPPVDAVLAVAFDKVRLVEGLYCWFMCA